MYSIVHERRRTGRQWKARESFEHRCNVLSHTLTMMIDVCQMQTETTLYKEIFHSKMPRYFSFTFKTFLTNAKSSEVKHFRCFSIEQFTFKRVVRCDVRKLSRFVRVSIDSLRNFVIIQELSRGTISLASPITVEPLIPDIILLNVNIRSINVGTNSMIRQFIHWMIHLESFPRMLTFYFMNDKNNPIVDLPSQEFDRLHTLTATEQRCRFVFIGFFSFVFCFSIFKETHSEFGE
jgi:hypothetical protein